MSETPQHTKSAEATRPQAGSAAWMRKRPGGLEVGPAPYTPPREKEIVVRNGAVAVAVYEDFLPAALAAGTFQAAPEPRGLQHIQAALDAQMQGVSAMKAVVCGGDQ